MAFAALNTGNNLLYLVLSLMLAFLVLSGVLSESALRGIAVRRREPRELMAGVEGTIGIEIHNQQRRVPALAIVIEDCRDHGDDRRLEKADCIGRSFALKVAAGGTEHRRYRITPKGRGVLCLAGIRVSTRFPFGLFSKSRILELPAAYVVYPAIDRGKRTGPRARFSEEGEAGRATRREGAEVAGVREHQPDDSLRRVHWKTSLRRGSLVVRELEDSEQRQVQVHLATTGVGTDEGFEDRVCRAASEVVHHIEQGARVALATDTERIEASSGERQRGRLLTFLAGVQPDAVATACPNPAEADAA